jgi:hypothetical protein
MVGPPPSATTVCPTPAAQFASVRQGSIEKAGTTMAHYPLLVNDTRWSHPGSMDHRRVGRVIFFLNHDRIHPPSLHNTLFDHGTLDATNFDHARHNHLFTNDRLFNHVTLDDGREATLFSVLLSNNERRSALRLVLVLSDFWRIGIISGLCRCQWHQRYETKSGSE